MSGRAKRIVGGAGPDHLKGTSKADVIFGDRGFRTVFLELDSSYDARIALDRDTVFSGGGGGGGGRGMTIALINPKNGRLVDVEHFDTFSFGGHVVARDRAIDYLHSVNADRYVVAVVAGDSIGTGFAPSVGKYVWPEGLFVAMESLGSGEIRNVGWRDTYVFATHPDEGVIHEKWKGPENWRPIKADISFAVSERKSGGGDDVIKAGGGADVVYAGPGDDTVSGGSGNDRLLGEAGADKLRGGKDHDRLDGDTGRDNLSGGKGMDELDGGAGADTLRGGPNSDIFVFGRDDGRDTIKDFKNGQDLISFEVPRLDFDDLTLKGGAGRTVIEHGDGTVVLQGVDMSSIDEGAFVFL